MFAQSMSSFATQHVTPAWLHEKLESDNWRVVVIFVVIADVIIFAVGGDSKAALVGVMCSMCDICDMVCRIAESCSLRKVIGELICLCRY